MLEIMYSLWFWENLYVYALSFEETSGFLEFRLLQIEFHKWIRVCNKLIFQWRRVISIILIAIFGTLKKWRKNEGRWKIFKKCIFSDPLHLYLAFYLILSLWKDSKFDFCSLRKHYLALFFNYYYYKFGDKRLNVKLRLTVGQLQRTRGTYYLWTYLAFC